MNITHESMLDPENPTVHGPVSKTTRSAHWCPSCRDWVVTQPEPDQTFVRKLAPGIAQFLENGHGDERKPVLEAIFTAWLGNDQEELARLTADASAGHNCPDCGRRCDCDGDENIVRQAIVLYAADRPARAQQGLATAIELFSRTLAEKQFMVDVPGLHDLATAINGLARAQGE